MIQDEVLCKSELVNEQATKQVVTCKKQNTKTCKASLLNHDLNGLHTHSNADVKFTPSLVRRLNIYKVSMQVPF